MELTSRYVNPNVVFSAALSIAPLVANADSPVPDLNTSHETGSDDKRWMQDHAKPPKSGIGIVAKGFHNGNGKSSDRTKDVNHVLTRWAGHNQFGLVVAGHFLNHFQRPLA